MEYLKQMVIEAIKMRKTLKAIKHISNLGYKKEATSIMQKEAERLQYIKNNLK